MNLGEEKTNEDLRNYFSEQCNSINETLSQARDFHYKQLSNKLEQFMNFNTKLGELSLLISAAITPILIVSNKNISQPVFVFLALFVYLTNGIFAIWRSKDVVEKQLDAFNPAMLYKTELEVYPLQFSMDKLKLEPRNPEYIKEFTDSRNLFLEKNTEFEIPKRTVDLTLDIILFNLVLATLLLSRTIWPFSVSYYWLSFAVIIIVMIILILRSYILAREHSVQNEESIKSLNKMKCEHIEWQKSHLYKESEGS